jgi:hypothetical protein
MVSARVYNVIRIDLDGSNTIYLRIIYGEEVLLPITDLDFFRIMHKKDDPTRMVRITIISGYSS